MTYRSLSQWCKHLSGVSPSACNSESEEAFHNEAGTNCLAGPTVHSTDSFTLDSVTNGRPQSLSIPLTLAQPLHSRLLQSISRPSMGCEFEVLLNEHQHPDGVERAAESLSIIEHLENLLSVYRPQSQISKVNRFAAERPVLVDAMTLELVQLGIDVHEWTLGAFDLTAGSLSEAWGFARRQGSMPTHQQIRQALSSVGSQHLLLNPAESTISLACDGVRLNSGGIGKGYALDYAARHLYENGIEHFMIHGGLSSIIARGGRNGLSNNHWNVALKHPWRTNETIEIISLENQALGTSGSGKQYFHFGGKRYSHLIDPRTGWPADQMMSTTVVCPSCGVADALATGFFILGPKAAMEFCEAHPEVAAVLIFTDPKNGKQRIEHCNWHDGTSSIPRG